MGRHVAQWERVLFELRKAGREGVTTNHIRTGMMIANPAQRIIELEARGHVISSTPEKRPDGPTIARYRLEHDAERTSLGAGRGGTPSHGVTGVLDSDPSGEPAALTLPAQAPLITETPDDAFGALLARFPRPSAFDPFSEAA
jgi:hypothetical protein